MNALKIGKCSLLGAVAFAAAGCAAVGPAADQVNPFYADSSGGFGERNASAILGASGGGAGGTEDARHALEVMSSYQRAHAPQPYYPVIRPAEVRLMWIPDHLTGDGNLVPAHYYYLKILNDDWEVQDAFEIEGLLEDGGVAADYGTGGGGGGGGGANLGGPTPWVYKESK